MAKYAFVTIAYLNDIGFMHLQARSMCRYVPRDLIAEIIVVENTPPKLPDIWRERLRKSYGPLRDLVRFISASSIAKIPLNTAGWFSQQVLKLMAAKVVTAPAYLLLDAKNHFIFPLTRAHMEAAGKPRMFTHGYQTHPLKRYLEPILKYFDLPLDHVKRMLPTTPPFYIPTALAREVIQTIAAHEKRDFEQVFLKSKVRFTEFFLLGAYILHKKCRFEDYYDLSGGNFSCIWKEMAPHDNTVSNEIARSEQRQAPFFAVHRASFHLLSDKSRTNIAQFWHRRQLFDTEADALRFFHEPNKV